MVFPRSRLAVFVDGDFWHGNQWRRRGFASLDEQFKESPSRSYWIPKIKRNVERDAQVNDRLQELGWRVLRLWESDICADAAACAERVEVAVRSDWVGEA
jgi:DNA mismatch endonuclease (patch repair protein)